VGDILAGTIPVSFLVVWWCGGVVRLEQFGVFDGDTASNKSEIGILSTPDKCLFLLVVLTPTLSQ